MRIGQGVAASNVLNHLVYSGPFGRFAEHVDAVAVGVVGSMPELVQGSAEAGGC
jgi:hypothetical protein